MFINYLVTALRSFKQQKQHFILNLLGLSIGLAAAILVALFAQNELSYDSQQPHAERVYRVGQDYSKLGLSVIPIFNYSQAAKATEYSQVEEVFGLTMVSLTREAMVDVQYRDQGFKLNDLYGATPNIENFININTLAGDLKNAMSTPESLALSESEALRIFGTINVIGNTLQHEQGQYTVRAVFADLPSNTHFAFKNLVYVKHDPNNLMVNSSYVYMRLAPQADPKTLADTLSKQYFNGQMAGQVAIELHPLLDLHLTAKSPFEMKAGGAKQVVTICAGLSVLLILIAGFNFINMTVAQSAKRAKEVFKGIAVGGTLFEELGFSYVGPIDGHDLDQLLPLLRMLKTRAKGPVLIHALTKKGKGYAHAESRPDGGHATAKFDVATGTQVKAVSNAPSYTKVFAESLIKEAAKDEKIVAVTAAMPDGTGLNMFAKLHPRRCFDVGIAEQHAVTFSAGLAASGMKPFCAIYSTFLQRGYDQIVHDVAIQRLPVRFAIDRAGLVGADGATHAGSFDVGFMASLPGMVVMAAADEAELVHMVATAAAHDEGPIAFRYPRGEGMGVDMPETGVPLEIGKGRIIVEGGRVAILSYGTRLAEVLKAREALQARGLAPTVADARFAKPLDTGLIDQLVANHEALICIEEGAIGGFGSHVAQYLSDQGVFDRGFKFRSMVLPDTFIDHASADDMYRTAGMDAPQIEAKVLELLGVAVAKRA